MLWFAFILLPLPYWKQLYSIVIPHRISCDLLSFYYLCRTGNNTDAFDTLWLGVVICFHFTTFAVLETTGSPESRSGHRLWFAFILLPLPYWKQRCWRSHKQNYGCDLLSFYYLCRTGNNPKVCKTNSRGVVICFHFTTFAVLETTGERKYHRLIKLWFAFILLPLPYWKQQNPHYWLYFSTL